MFNKNRKSKYKEIIKYSGFFQNQKEEIDTLIRIINYLNSILNKEELKEIDKEFNTQYYGSRSTKLYSIVFEDLKKRSFPISNSNSDDDFLLNDNKEAVFSLYICQEEEIENLFKRMIKILKIIEKKQYDLPFSYLSFFDYLNQYEKGKKTYFSDIHLGTEKDENRFFKMQDEDRKEYIRLFDKIKTAASNQ